MQMQRAWEPLGERVSAQKGHAYTQIPGHTHRHFDTWAHSLIHTHNQPFYSIPFRNPNFAFGSLRYGFAILKYWVRTFFFPSYAYMHSVCRWLFFFLISFHFFCSLYSWNVLSPCHHIHIDIYWCVSHGVYRVVYTVVYTAYQCTVWYLILHTSSQIEWFGVRMVRFVANKMWIEWYYYFYCHYYYCYYCTYTLAVASQK